MKLLVDVDKVSSNLRPLETAISDYSAAVSTFSDTTIDCPLDEIKGVLDSYKETINKDLKDLNTSSKEYDALVDNCCTAYKENESNTQEISVEPIAEIVKSAPELFSTDYKGKAAAKLTGIPTTDLGFKVCDAAYAPSDKTGLNGTFTDSSGRVYEIYNQTAIYNNQGSWGVSWNANDKCTRCAVASLVSGYSPEGGRKALNRSAEWGAQEMLDTIYECSDGKLTANYTDYSSNKIKDITSDGGYALVYVTNSPAKSGMTWASSQHAMALLDYRETDNGGQVFISTSGRQPGSTEGLWVSTDEFDNVMKSNQIIEVKET